MSELKPCPFCGGEGSIRWSLGWFTIQCDTCSDLAYATEKEAIEQWNTRTEPGRCRDCRWWGQAFKENFGNCKSIEFHNSVRVGLFYPGPDFGCIHFEKKEG